MATALFWLGASPLGPLAASLLVVIGLLVALRKQLAEMLTALRARVAPPQGMTAHGGGASTIAPLPSTASEPAASGTPPAE